MEGKSRHNQLSEESVIGGYLRYIFNELKQIYISRRPRRFNDLRSPEEIEREIILELFVFAIYPFLVNIFIVMVFLILSYMKDLLYLTT